jgi:protein-disulfide isomerase
MKAAVVEDAAVISAIGQTGTPTFFVNGTPVVGAQPVENFQKLIDEKLAGS